MSPRSPHDLDPRGGASAKSTDRPDCPQGGLHRFDGIDDLAQHLESPVNPSRAMPTSKVQQTAEAGEAVDQSPALQQAYSALEDDRVCRMQKVGDANPNQELVAVQSREKNRRSAQMC